MHTTLCVFGSTSRWMSDAWDDSSPIDTKGQLICSLPYHVCPCLVGCSLHKCSNSPVPDRLLSLGLRHQTWLLLLYSVTEPSYCRSERKYPNSMIEITQQQLHCSILGIILREGLDESQCDRYALIPVHMSIAQSLNCSKPQS